MERLRRFLRDEGSFEILASSALFKDRACAFDKPRFGFAKPSAIALPALTFPVQIFGREALS